MCTNCRVNKPKFSSINMAVFGLQEAPSIFSVFTDLHEYTFCVNQPPVVSLKASCYSNRLQDQSCGIWQDPS